MERSDYDVKKYYNNKDISNPIAAMDYIIDGKPLTYEEYKKLFIDPNIKLLNLEPHHKVLDAGCGAGLILKEVEKLVAHAEGFDISENLLKAFDGKSKVICASVLDVEYPEEFFDRIYMIGVALYFPSIDKFFSAVERLLGFVKPGGFLLIGDQLISDLYKSDKYFSISFNELINFFLSKKLHFSILAQIPEKRYRNRYDIVIYK